MTDSQQEIITWLEENTTVFSLRYIGENAYVNASNGGWIIGPNDFAPQPTNYVIAITDAAHDNGDGPERDNAKIIDTPLGGYENGILFA